MSAVDAATGTGGAPSIQKLIWRSEPNSPTGWAIGGSGEKDIWVVQSGFDIWHSNGDGKWLRRDSGNKTDRMDGVWGTGPDDVYVAPHINYILHWKSGMWVKETMGIPLSVVFHEFWGTGPNDVYVAGGGVMHTTGDGVWESVVIPPDTNGVGSITGSGREVWGLGLSGLVIHSSNGGRWTSEDPGLMGYGNDIWAAGPDEVYVIGAGEIRHRRGGGSWAKEELDVVASGGLRSVWGSGPTDVYVLGSKGYLFHSTGDGRWSRELIDPARPNLPLDGIWGTSAQNVYVLTAGGVLHGTPQ